jgi:predicted phosphoadenosine phosphosulfate sulfurtransferase
MTKVYTDIDVLSSAVLRIEHVFDEFDHVCVSFSGGKDSTVLLHLAHAEAVKRNRVIDVLFIDWEAQYRATIDHVAEMMQLSNVRPIWVALPMSTSNENSFYDPIWTAWHPEEKEKWVREYPPNAITDYFYFPFYTFGMTFEEFVPKFNDWYALRGKSAFMIGIRSDESLNRFRTVKKRLGSKRNVYKNWSYSTKTSNNGYNVYPIYDWRVEDVWGYVSKFKLPYNTIYDKMYLSGMSLKEMRICEPYSREARKSLHKYHVLEPETWDKIVARAGGVNFGSLYGDSTLFGYRHITKPDNTTWKEYALVLLDTLPPPLKDHYTRRIQVFIDWFKDNRGWDDLKDESDLDLEMKNQGGSWRMVCRTLLKNDYFCTHLSFSINKREFEKYETLKEKYKDL